MFSYHHTLWSAIVHRASRHAHPRPVKCKPSALRPEGFISDITDITTDLLRVLPMERDWGYGGEACARRWCLGWVFGCGWGIRGLCYVRAKNLKWSNDDTKVLAV